MDVIKMHRIAIMHQSTVRNSQSSKFRLQLMFMRRLSSLFLNVLWGPGAFSWLLNDCIDMLNPLPRVTLFMIDTTVPVWVRVFNWSFNNDRD